MLKNVGINILSFIFIWVILPKHEISAVILSTVLCCTKSTIMTTTTKTRDMNKEQSYEMQFPYIWDKVFKNRPSKICGRHPFKFFKGCPPQILPGPFLNTLPHIILKRKSSRYNVYFRGLHVF